MPFWDDYPDSSKINHDSRVRSNSELVVIYPDISWFPLFNHHYHSLTIIKPLLIILNHYQPFNHYSTTTIISYYLNYSLNHYFNHYLPILFNHLTHMLNVWYIYLHGWVFLQMLVHIPAPWFAYGLFKPFFNHHKPLFKPMILRRLLPWCHLFDEL